jgi:hypothetical protein
MTTQLFWVPNHALAGWLSIGLLCRHTRSHQLNLLLPVLVVAAALWSPLTALGLLPFVLLRVVGDSVRDRSARLMLPQVWVPAALIGLTISAYLILDPGGIAKGVAVGENHEAAIMDLLQQAQFFLLEAGFIGAAIFALRPSRQVAMAMIVLALLPLVYFGPANDLVMRASIPSLAVLTIFACLALCQRAPDLAGRRKQAVLGMLLLIGAITPIAEVARGILLPVWPINTSATLIGANCGQYAPHYVARRDGGSVIDRLMRQTHRLPLGPQGPAACNNPAVELMWSWSWSPRPPALRPLFPRQANVGNP